MVKDNGHQYFIKFLDSPDIHAEQQAMAAFVLTVIVDGHRRGQEECLQCGLVSICLQHIQTWLSTDGQRDTMLLKWLCLCLGKLWEGYDLAQQQGLQASAPAILMQLLSETQPEVSYLGLWRTSMQVKVSCFPKAYIFSGSCCCYFCTWDIDCCWK